MHRFRMNWGAGGRRIETSDDHSIFVGDLAPDVTDELLLGTFSARFTSVRGAKVVMDPVTRVSKGFGFVRFGSKEEADQALQTMNGVYCSSRPMRVSVATERSKSRQQGVFGAAEEEGANTTVFVGGLDPSTTEDELRARFGALGEIVSVKVPPGRGCGFVQYTSKEAAEVAITQMNGTVVSGVKVRCAWGRSAAARAANHGGYYNQQYGQYQAGYQVRVEGVCVDNDAALLDLTLVAISYCCSRTTMATMLLTGTRSTNRELLPTATVPTDSTPSRAASLRAGTSSSRSNSSLSEVSRHTTATTATSSVSSRTSRATSRGLTTLKL